MGKQRRARGFARPKEPPPGLYDVPEPESRHWPEETYCRNVMCRQRFWRAYGESEFCLACRNMLHLDWHGKRVV